MNIFKQGDWVRCIDNKYNEEYLTLNSVYNVIDFDTKRLRIKIRDDKYNQFYYISDNFELDIIKVRNEIINDILK